MAFSLSSSMWLIVTELVAGFVMQPALSAERPISRSVSIIVAHFIFYRDGAFVAITRPVFQPLKIIIDADLKTATYFAADNPHNVDRLVDLFAPVARLVDIPSWISNIGMMPGFAEPPGRQAQHLGLVALHWEIEERPFVRTRTEVKRPAGLFLCSGPASTAWTRSVRYSPRPRIPTPVAFDDAASNQLGWRSQP